MYFEPCNPGDPDAVPGDFLSLTAQHGTDAVAAPALRMSDFEAAMQRVRPSIKPEEIVILNEFREQVASAPAASV